MKSSMKLWEDKPLKKIASNPRGEKGDNPPSKKGVYMNSATQRRYCVCNVINHSDKKEKGRLQEECGPSSR